MSQKIPFEDAFHALTGHEPFPWQRELYEWLIVGNTPSACRIPTGLGKTAVIAVWLIALARLGKGTVNGKRLARRLVYVVNRRTVVDQSTDEVMKLRKRLIGKSETSALNALRESLNALSTIDDDDCPLAISTLRGEMADNEQWKADPSRPAVVVGTVDMIGSKLLFSGYGDSFRRQPHHAGLLGQDTLVIHDEAHLEPAFQRLLTTIEEEQARCGDPWPMQVMELTATSRGDNGEETKDTTITLSKKDEKHPVVKDRIKAKKNIAFHSVSNEKKQAASRIADLALDHQASGQAILVFLRTLADVKTVAEKLGKEKANFKLLTGTIRGKERDELVKTRLFQRFLHISQRHPDTEAAEGTVYLICTSAGEVGIDASADHMVGDLSTLESMIQRLGRVNRFGDGDARVDVVHPTSFDTNSPLHSARARTLDVLKDLPEHDGRYDASPTALAKRINDLTKDEKDAAFSPPPIILPATDILFDAWALTTIREKLPGRPEVAPYLHGVSDYDPPRTYIAWREEVAVLGEAKVGREGLTDWFRVCPIASYEQLSENTSELKKSLGKLLSAHRKGKSQADFDPTVVVLDERGVAEFSTLSEIIEKDFNLDHRTIVLPVEAAGLDRQGMLNPDLNPKKVEPNEQLDVAETRENENPRQRWRLTENGEEKTCKRLATAETREDPPADLREAIRIVLQESIEGAEDESQAKYLLLMVPPRQQALTDPERAKFNQTLSEHSAVIAEYAKSMAGNLSLGSSLEEAFIQAAVRHDLGKAQPVWQRYARNQEPEPLAKSRKHLHGRALGGYRHEFGSLLEAARDGGITSSDRDLALHLIAAHHGWARPHFQPRAGGSAGTTAENEQTVIEAMQRFGRLQQRYGCWGLAYLESLLRAADALASRPANGEKEEDPS